MKKYLVAASLIVGLAVFSCQNPLQGSLKSFDLARTLPAVSQVISLRANINNGFVSADQNLANTQLVANRASASGWESFQVLDAGNGTIALKASNGMYVSADLNIAANAPLVATRTAINTWETFQWIDLGNGQVNLKAMATGKFVSADQNLGSILVADRATAGGWETFTWAASSGTVLTPALSLAPWFLQLPDGSTLYNLAGKTNTWFYPDGSYLAFADPVSGVTTSGSQHPRSELHEIATWTSSGTNTLTVSGRVKKYGNGAICIGQVFCDNGPNGAHTLAELLYTPTGFQVLYEEAKGAASVQQIGGAVAVGTAFSYKLSLSDKQLKITANGVSYSKTPSSAGASGNFYFKAGNYDQSSTKADSPSTGINSIFEISNLDISHL